MSLLKSVFAGIGTGSGVAWPLFGIVSSALSLGIGGTLVISVGSICCVLFLAVSIPVFYIAYKKIMQEERLLNDKLKSNLLNFIDNLHHAYLADKESNYHFRDYVNTWLMQEKEKGGKNNLQIKLIKGIKKFSPNFLRNYDYLSPLEKKKELALIIQHGIDWSDLNEELSSPPKNELLNTAFLSFVGVFGSVAGCSSGFVGVFTAMGLITGFGAIPVLGAIILIAAVGCAAYAAAIAIESDIAKNKKTQIYKNLKAYNKNFAEQNIAEKEQIYDIQPHKDQLKGSPSFEHDPDKRAATIASNPAHLRGTIFHRTRDTEEGSEAYKADFNP